MARQDPPRQQPRKPNGPVQQDSSFRLRPSRLPLLWAVPGTLVSGALAFSFFVYRGYGVQTVVPLGFIAFFYFLGVLSLLLLGSTSVAASGIRNRTVVGTRQVKWKEVDQIEVRPTTLGRKTIVTLKKGKGVFTLAAPREGLLARDAAFQEKFDELLKWRKAPNIAVGRRKRPPRLRLPAILLVVVVLMLLREQPWKSDWWPGRDEAAALPRACEVADEATARRLLATRPTQVEDHHEDRDPFYTSACRWERARPLGVVELSYQRFGRVGGASGSGVAAERMDHYWLGTDRVPRLGEQAWERVRQVPGGGRHVDLWARRANVIVHVDYAGFRTEEELTAAARDLARRALARLALQ